MIKFILFGAFSILVTIYVLGVGSVRLDGGLFLTLIPFFGCILLALSSGFYLRENLKRADLFALLGLGLISNSTLISWVMIPQLLDMQSYKYLFLLLPGLGTLFLYFVTIRQYLRPEISQFEFVNFNVGKVERNILFYVPIAVTIFIFVYFKYLT